MSYLPMIGGQQQIVSPDDSVTLDDRVQSHLNVDCIRSSHQHEVNYEQYSMGDGNQYHTQRPQHDATDYRFFEIFSPQDEPYTNHKQQQQQEHDNHQLDMIQYQSNHQFSVENQSSHGQMISFNNPMINTTTTLLNQAQNYPIVGASSVQDFNGFHYVDAPDKIKSIDPDMNQNLSESMYQAQDLNNNNNTDNQIPDVVQDANQERHCLYERNQSNPHQQAGFSPIHFRNPPASLSSIDSKLLTIDINQRSTTSNNHSQCLTNSQSSQDFSTNNDISSNSNFAIGYQPIASTSYTSSVDKLDCGRVSSASSCVSLDDICCSDLYDFDQSSTTGSSNETSATSTFESNGSVGDQSKRSSIKHLNRNRGRPRRKNSKTKCKVNGKLWEFIRDLLLNDRTNPSFIRWERREDGIFKFVQSHKVAMMWGERKQNPKMTYEKLSRAMRYYYKSKVLLPVFGRRLVYKFGPNATGWMDSPK